MASKSNITGDLDFLTDRLSTQVRTTALGVLVFSWGLLMGESTVAKSLAAQLKWDLVAIAALAVLAMLFDILQYLFGYWNTRKVLSAMEAAGKTEASYDYSSCLYRLRSFFFAAKMVAMTAGAVWLVFVLGRWLSTS
jgi:hypothetical protein